MIVVIRIILNYKYQLNLFYMKTLKLLATLCTVCLVASCGITKFQALPSPTDSNNFEYVRSVESDVSFTYILGFGGLTDKDVYEKLKENAGLLPGEALVNVTLKRTTKIFLGIVIKANFHASAQVVRYTDGNYLDMMSIYEAKEQNDADLVTVATLKRRVSGYDGDILSAFPASVSVSFNMTAKKLLSSYGVSISSRSAADAVMEGFNAFTKENKLNREAMNHMEVIVTDCSASGDITGYAIVKNEYGEEILKIYTSGTGLKTKRDYESMYLNAFKEIGVNIFNKFSSAQKVQAKSAKARK